MNTRSGFSARVLVTSLMIACAGGPAFGQQAGPAAEPSKERREQMAVLHEKMAACLRSDKDLAACREEMRNNCRDMMGDQGCPMMDGMHEGMMQHAPGDKPHGT